jgi:hypothetical protein
MRCELNAPAQPRTNNRGSWTHCGDLYADPMRNYQKVEIALRIALDMLSSTSGVSLQDIRFAYSDKPLSRRTAERYRNTLKRVFPQFEEVNPHQYPRRWRLSNRLLIGLAKISSRDLARLADAAARLRRVKEHQAANRVAYVASKLQSER